ncbi:MAG: hypothetical protein QXO21_05590, partial [Candidatus Anstonellales archaeon]
MAYANIITFAIIAILCFILLLLLYSQLDANFSSIVSATKQKEQLQYVQAEHQKLEIERINLNGSCSLGYNIVIYANNKGNAQVNLDKLSVQINGQVVQHQSSGVLNPGTTASIKVTTPIISSPEGDRITLTTDSGIQIFYSYNCSEIICSYDTYFTEWDYNSTYAGKSTKFFIAFSDNDIINYYRFLFDNCTGEYTDLTGWILNDQFYGSVEQILTLNDTINCTIRARIETKDKCDNLEYSELIFNTTNLSCINDAFSVNGWKWNSTIANSWSNLSINVTDLDGIYSYVFGFDNGTGTYVYENPIYVSNTELNFSKSVKLNPVVGKLIRFILIVNDSCNITKLFSGSFL